MLKKRLITCIITMACAFACVFPLAGCGSSDANNFVGEWKIKDTDVTVVFTGDEFKLVGNTFGYSVDPGAKTLTLTAGDATGTSAYSFSNNNQTLTLEEDDGNGGTKTTVFEKISNDGSAEPSANGVEEDE